MMRSATPRVQVKRIYDPPEDKDGRRILVDRLWPRGLRKADAAIDLWLKEVAPSDELRRWFAHDPTRWEEFRIRYAAELADKPNVIARLRNLIADGPATLLFAAHDRDHNNAVALRDLLSASAND